MTLTVDVQHRLGTFALNASFTSEHGVTALFGRSGSGKTSVIRIIAGLEKPDNGRIVLNGVVLADTQQGIFIPRHKRRFGYVFQESRLFPHLSVRQNLKYGQWFLPKTERSGNLDQVVGLLGIENLLERQPNLLSGGEKQRVAIGRALLSSPRLLLMDEPLAALDNERKEEILPYLELLRDEMHIPIVYVSHSVSEVARLADRVVMMSAGNVISSGTPSETLSHPSVAMATSRKEAGVLLEGVCTHYDPDHRLATITLKAEKLLVPANQNTVGKRVRVHIPARDVMLATVNPVGISALNVLAGTVLTITDGSDNMMDVLIDCSGDIIRSRVTKLSCQQLELDRGKPVYAIVKTAALATD